jgi:hypothetical protein
MRMTSKARQRRERPLLTEEKKSAESGRKRERGEERGRKRTACPGFPWHLASCCRARSRGRVEHYRRREIVSAGGEEDGRETRGQRNATRSTERGRTESNVQTESTTGEVQQDILDAPPHRALLLVVHPRLRHTLRRRDVELDGGEDKDEVEPLEDGGGGGEEGADEDYEDGGEEDEAVVGGDALLRIALYTGSGFDEWEVCRGSTRTRLVDEALPEDNEGKEESMSGESDVVGLDRGQVAAVTPCILSSYWRRGVKSYVVGEVGGKPKRVQGDEVLFSHGRVSRGEQSSS